MTSTCSRCAEFRRQGPCSQARRQPEFGPREMNFHHILCYHFRQQPLLQFRFGQATTLTLGAVNYQSEHKGHDKRRA